MSLRAAIRNPFERGSLAISLALALLLLALFMPPVKLQRDTYDYIVVFDISQSMYVEDYELNGSPVSRLAFAQESARRALRSLPCGSRVGWGAFTGYRTMLLLAPVEVCANYSDLLASLAKIDGGMRWSEASEISKGIYWSIRAAQETDSHPSVLFLTDGQEAPPVDPGSPAPMLADLNGSTIRGWLLGTGGYTPSPIPKFDAEGRREGYWRSYEVIQVGSLEHESGVKVLGEHLSGLREPHLQELAKRIGFGYARIADESSLSLAMRDPRLSRRRAVATDLDWLPAGLALLILAWRFRPAITLRREARRT
jgi:mxaL protein